MSTNGRLLSTSIALGRPVSVARLSAEDRGERHVGGRQHGADKAEQRAAAPR